MRTLLRLALGAPLLVTGIFGQEIYDLLLKNGHVIDPANKRNGRLMSPSPAPKSLGLALTWQPRMRASSWTPANTM